MTRCVLAAVCLAVWAPLVSGLHNMYEWSSIDYAWPSPDTKQRAVADGSYAPSKIRLGHIQEFDGTVYVCTPRNDGVPVTLSAVVEKDGQPLLAPFPDWEQAKQTNVGTFDIDRKGRLYAIEHSPEGDMLAIYSLKTRKMLRKQPLPKNEGRVTALVVDDHGRSHTHISDDLSSTVFMLAATPSSGNRGALIVFTYQHKGDVIKAFSLPSSFDSGSSDAVLSMSITGNGDTVYLNSPTQIWSFQASGPRQGSEMRMYPVCGKPSSSELQAVSYHPSSRQLVFGRDENLYKINPLEAWSKTFEEQQVQLTTDSGLTQMSSIVLDWKYDFLVASQSKEWKDGQVNHRIAVLPTMELLQTEQRQIREKMDFSDL